MTIEEAIEKANEVTGGEIALKRKHGLWVVRAHDYQHAAGTTMVAAVEALIADRVYRAAENAEREAAKPAPVGPCADGDNCPDARAHGAVHPLNGAADAAQ